MKKTACLAATASLLVGCALAAFALASEYAPGQYVRRPGSTWPAGLEKLVNQDSRIYGYFVNFSDWFFFTGDAAAFNSFAADYGKLKDTPLTLVLHPGHGRTGKLGASEADPKVEFDWKVSVLRRGRHPDAPADGSRQYVVQLDLWLGGQVELDKVKVPLSIEVKSGGEIEGFITAHQDAKSTHTQ